MSLLRLLTAGKSLVGLNKSEARYHLPGERALPEFGGKKNPFRATVMPEKVESNQAGGTAAPDAQSPAQLPSIAQVPFHPHPQKGDPHGPLDNGATSQPSRILEQPARRPSGIRAFLLWGR